MAQIRSVLSLDYAEIESLWLAMVGWNYSGMAVQPTTRRILAIVDGASAADYLAIHVAAAAIGAQILEPPVPLRQRLLREWSHVDSLLDAVVVADPSADLPDEVPLVVVSGPEGRPLDILSHLYGTFVTGTPLSGPRVLCDDSNARSWCLATGELPIRVIHTGSPEAVDPEMMALLKAEGQAGTFRIAAGHRGPAAIDARRTPSTRILASAIAAALEFAMGTPHT